MLITMSNIREIKKKKNEIKREILSSARYFTHTQNVFTVCMAPSFIRIS